MIPRVTVAVVLALVTAACAEVPTTAPSETAPSTEAPSVAPGGGTAHDHASRARKTSPPPGAYPEFAHQCQAARDTTDPYFGTQLLREAENRLRQAQARTDIPPDMLTRLRVMMSEHLMRLGRLDEALDQLARARSDVEDVRPGSGLWLSVMMQSAVASIRLGERSNCRMNYGAASCILPLRDEGLHIDPAGSRAAIGHLEQVLAVLPRDEIARYLLNLAHMTLGTYPDGVPADYLIPPQVFASTVDIGFFRNVAPERGVDVWSLAGGSILEDFDRDGDLDLMVSTWDPCQPMQMFRNDGQGMFEDVSEWAGVASQLGGLNLAQADYDNDGAVDVLVLRGGWQGGSDLGRQRNSLLRNLGDGRFEDVTSQARLARPGSPTQSAAWGDYDLDGNLDLYVCNEGTGIPGAPEIINPGQLYHNRGDGTFEDVAGQAGAGNLRYCKGAVWGDYDDDGDPDLYISNLNSANRLYRNNGDGTFTDVAHAAGVTGPPGSFPTWFWDYDNDGRLDLWVGSYLADPRLYMAEYLGSRQGTGYARIYRNNGDGTFTDLSEALGIRRAQMLMGANFGDLDNDGWLDFYGGVGAPNFEALFPNPMFRNDRGVRFQDVTESGGFGHLQKGHGISFGDVDGDGDQDVHLEVGAAYADDGFGNALFLNPGHGNRYLKLELEGAGANRSAIGARVRVVAREGDTTQEFHRVVGSGGSFGANPLRVELGLGQATAVEKVEILWPVANPQPQVFTGLELDAAYILRQGQPTAMPLAGS